MNTEIITALGVFVVLCFTCFAVYLALLPSKKKPSKQDIATELGAVMSNTIDRMMLESAGLKPTKYVYCVHPSEFEKALDMFRAIGYTVRYTDRLVCEIAYDWRGEEIVHEIYQWKFVEPGQTLRIEKEKTRIPPIDTGIMRQSWQPRETSWFNNRFRYRF